jgi:hypothetical protein
LTFLQRQNTEGVFLIFSISLPLRSYPLLIEKQMILFQKSLKNPLTLCFMLVGFSMWAQNTERKGLDWQTPIVGAKKLLTYKKSIVGAASSLILTNDNSSATLKELNSEKGNFLENIKSPNIQPNDVVVAFNERIWVASEKNITAFSILNGKKIDNFPITTGNRFSQMAIGFNHTVFLLDNQKNQIHVLSKRNTNLLVEDSRLNKATSFVMISGTLYIGVKNQILSFNIRKKEFSIYADNLAPVLGLDIDHLTLLVALTDKNIVRIGTDNKVEKLMENDLKHPSFSINPTTKKLLLLDEKGTVSALDYAQITKESPQEAQLRSKRAMKVFDTKDLSLVGSEYIIHAENANHELRETYLEGFYPEKGKVENGSMSDITPNEMTIACAEKSYQAFVKWSKKVSKDFKNTVANGTPPTFWLMVNDYSGIKGTLPSTLRKASVWYWKRNPEVVGRYPGFWKWEAVLNQKCVCELPNETEAEQFFKDFIKQKNN